MKRFLDILVLLNNHGFVTGGELCAEHDIIWFSGPELSDDEIDMIVESDGTYDGDDECIKQLLTLGAFWDTDGDSWAVFT